MTPLHDETTTAFAGFTIADSHSHTVRRPWPITGGYEIDDSEVDSDNDDKTSAFPCQSALASRASFFSKLGRRSSAPVEVINSSTRRFAKALLRKSIAVAIYGKRVAEDGSENDDCCEYPPETAIDAATITMTTAAEPMILQYGVLNDLDEDDTSPRYGPTKGGEKQRMKKDSSRTLYGGNLFEPAGIWYDLDSDDDDHCN